MRLAGAVSYLSSMSSGECLLRTARSSADAASEFSGESLSCSRTEQAFVKQVLAPHLQYRGVFAVAPLVRRGGRGGKVHMGALADRMSALARARSDTSVTSLVDLYGFVDKREASAEDLEEQTDAAIRERIGSRFNEEAVFSYVQQYEFEALLLSDAESARKWPSETIAREITEGRPSGSAARFLRSCTCRCRPTP